jgi:hypothetical protein
LIFHDFLPELPNRHPTVWHFCSRCDLFGLACWCVADLAAHRLHSEFLPVVPRRVSLDFAERLVTSDGGDPVRTDALLSNPPRPRLTQAMRG